MLLLKSHRKKFEKQFLSTIIKGKKQWKMKDILNSKMYYNKLQYFLSKLKYFDKNNE